MYPQCKAAITFGGRRRDGRRNNGHVGRRRRRWQPNRFAVAHLGNKLSSSRTTLHLTKATTASQMLFHIFFPLPTQRNGGGENMTIGSEWPLSSPTGSGRRVPLLLSNEFISHLFLTSLLTSCVCVWLFQGSIDFDVVYDTRISPPTIPWEISSSVVDRWRC